MPPAELVSTPTQEPQQQVVRSPAFRLIYASVHRTRIGHGDCTLTFSSVLDLPGAPLNLIQEEFAVTLSWSLLKSLGNEINDAVKAIEEVMGEIPSIPTVRSHEEFAELLASHVRMLFGVQK